MLGWLDSSDQPGLANAYNKINKNISKIIIK